MSTYTYVPFYLSINGLLLGRHACTNIELTIAYPLRLQSQRVSDNETTRICELSNFLKTGVRKLDTLKLEIKVLVTPSYFLGKARRHTISNHCN